MSGFVLPDVDDVVAGPFWAGCAAGELRVQACTSCGRRRFPPRPMCPACTSLDARWDVVAPLATVWSFAVPHPPLLPVYAGYAPYVVAVVALDDDPSIRMAGPLVSGDGAPMGSVAAGDVTIGAPVRATFHHIADSVTLPWWVYT